MQESITRLRNALKIAKSFDEVRGQIRELQSYIFGTASHLICSFHLDTKNYSQVLSLLFEQVIPSWYICFTDEDQEYLRNQFLENPQVPLQFRFESISSLLVPDILQDSANSQLICSTVENILNANFESLLEYISVTSAPLATNVFIQIIISIPDRLANALQHQLPAEFLPKRYYPAILSNVLSYLQSYHQEKDFICAAHLLARICKLGYYSDFVQIYLEFTIKNPSSIILSKLFHNLPENLTESIVHYLLIDLSSMPCEEASKILLSILQYDIPQSKSLQYAITNKLFVTKTYKKHTIILLSHFLNQIHLAYPTNEEYSLTNVLNNIVNIWRDSLFIRNSSLPQHQNISNSIIELLKYVSKEELLSSQLVPKLIQGVQSHLESPQFPIRNQGMNVATCFSTIIDPTNPLKFDDMTEEEESQVNDTPKVPEAKVEKKVKTVKKGTKFFFRANLRKKHILMIQMLLSLEMKTH
jgi:hypothetical protein